MPATAEEVQCLIAHCNGCETVYRHRLCRGHRYTQGVRDLAELAGAWWLVDAICISSRCHKLQARTGDFEFWKLTVADRRGVLICTDGNSPEPVYSQAIPCTDFPLTEVTFYLEAGLLMLPGER